LISLYLIIIFLISLNSFLSAVLHNSKIIDSVVVKIAPLWVILCKAISWSTLIRLPMESDMRITSNPYCKQSKTVCWIQICVSIPQTIKLLIFLFLSSFKNSSNLARLNSIYSNFLNPAMGDNSGIVSPNLSGFCSDINMFSSKIW